MTETPAEHGGQPVLVERRSAQRRVAVAAGPPPVVVRLEPCTSTLQREWEDLARAVAAPPFVWPGWTSAWSEAYQAGRQPGILTGRCGDELVAVLPVLASRGVMRSATNIETPIFEPVLAGPDVAAPFVQGALALSRRRLDLGSLWSGGQVEQALSRLAAGRGHPVRTELLGRSPYVDVSGSWSDYELRRSSRRRRELGRRQRRLAELGPLTFEMWDGRYGDGDDLSRLLDEGFAVEASGWKGRARTAVDTRSDMRHFFRAAAAWAAGEGFLRLAMLRSNGRPFAFSYLVEHATTLYAIKIGYDPAFARFSPGSQLALRILQYAFAQPGLDQLNMLGKDDTYKLAFADGTQDQVRVVVFTRRWSGRAERRLAQSEAALRAWLPQRLPTGLRVAASDLHERLTGQKR